MELMSEWIILSYVNLGAQSLYMKNRTSAKLFKEYEEYMLDNLNNRLLSRNSQVGHRFRET